MGAARRSKPNKTAARTNPPHAVFTTPSVTPSPTTLVESRITAGSEPVLGLYLHVAYMAFMANYESEVGRGEISPNVIGLLATLDAQPGMSQADLARFIGLERATVGVTVGRAVASGFVRRTDSKQDARRYSLFITPLGEQMLVKLRQRIPTHERAAASRLTLDERRHLRALLNKLVYG